MSALEAAGREVVIATENPGKCVEIRAILDGVSISLVGLDRFGKLQLPDEGDDYTANAIGKAQAAAQHTGRVALGDDSGLEVEGLGGKPGPFSARYGGPGLDDAGRVAYLLREMGALTGEGRRARFVCVAALATADGAVVSARGECAGRILAGPRGEEGFGYDPIFEADGTDRSMAELPAAQKNQISHRARAFRALREAITAHVGRS